MSSGCGPRSSPSRPPRGTSSRFGGSATSSSPDPPATGGDHRAAAAGHVARTVRYAYVRHAVDRPSVRPQGGRVGDWEGIVTRTARGRVGAAVAAAGTAVALVAVAPAGAAGATVVSCGMEVSGSIALTADLACPAS